jgi:hypothetical protein
MSQTSLKAFEEEKGKVKGSTKRVVKRKDTARGQHG